MIAALPADEAASLSNVIAGWLTPETAHLQASPHNIIAMLAGAGHVEAALHVTGAVFQVFERGGELTGLFEPTMYEHYLSGAVNELAKAGPLLALPQFCDLLMDASRMDRNLGSVREEDYSYYMVGSLEPGPAHGGDILSTLIRAIVIFALAAVDADPSTVRRVLETLSKYSPRIFRRIELHTLARAPAEAADLADGYLTDTALIDAGWCREEYGELARAWLPDLPADRRQLIFAFIDAVPEGFLETWHASFEQYHGRKPGAEDDREFREITVRDLIWEWRDALPPDRRAALDKTVAEFGDPNARRDRHLAGDQPSLTRASMQSQPVEDTVAYLEAWRPDPALQTHTAAGLAYELREAAAAKQELFSAEAAKFIRVRPLFVRHLLDGLRQPTANGAKIEWAPCLELLGAILDRSEAQQDRVPVPGDDPDWSWTLQSAIGWLASALGRGADGVAFIHANLVRSLVFTLYHRVGRLPVPKAEPRSDRKHSYVASLQTLRGGVVELCVLFVFWQSKDPASEIGKAPREAFARSPELRSILEAELRERSPAGWMPRAVLGRYLSWLFYFGEDWLREQIANLFPANSEELKASAWLGHLQYDKHPIGELVGQLHPYYAEHIAKLGRDDAPPGYDESANRLVDFLMILYLREELPDDLLKQFCDTAPAESRRHAMWFAGRHMVSSNSFRLRAMSYWEERLRAALSASDPEPYRRELGTIGQFFFWDVDPLWLMDQLLIMLNGGFAPNDAIGVLDKLAKLLPAQIDRVVEVTKVMVKQPKVEAWIFAAQDQSLRKILIEGKASAAPGTASAVREIMSFLASRGNPSFLDLDD